MRKIFFTALFLISISSFGQSLKHLKVYCTDNFNPNTSITVTPPNSDVIGMTDMIKNNLVMNGFKVISEAVAKQRVELSNKKQTSDTTLDQKISVGKTTYINSLYVITFTYDPFINFSGNYILALNGQVVDLANEGEIVATFSYQHGSMGARTPRIVVEALCKALKEKKKSK